MKSVDRLLKKMRRQWILEHCARSGLLMIAGAVNVALICWLLHKAVEVPAWSLLVVAGGAVLALGALVAGARAKAPSLKDLAKLADDRAGTEDLFSSAMEFGKEPERFGWLGAET
ncbi:MAG: hypothetical protein FWD53_07535, partial [Phycisphaerales bacterium]|nr:hypothetical protein [Phycisphaerales bacterium]